MSRLTLQNARKGREAGWLQIEEWKDAFKDGWIDTQRLKKLSEDDQLLVKSMKIAYQAVRGVNFILHLLTFLTQSPIKELILRPLCLYTFNNIFIDFHKRILKTAVHKKN